MPDRWMLPGPPRMNPDMMAAAPMSASYPLAQYSAQPTPATLALARGTRTLVPLVQGDSATTFNEFATTRIDTANSRIKPAQASERMLARISIKLDRDPASGLLSTVLGGGLTAVSGIPVLNYLLTSPQAAHLEIDVGTTAAPNIIFAETTPLQFLPTAMGITVPLFGGAPFLANGARFYPNVTTGGLIATDIRLLLQQARA